MTNKVKIKENIVPPTITTPIPILLADAAPRDNAIGKAPNAMAKLVINIGRKRATEASNIASYYDFPCSRS